MAAADYTTVSLAEIRAAWRRGDFSLSDLVEAYLHRARETAHHNAFVELFAADARQRAANLQERYGDSDTTPPPLLGAVISIKDNICFADHAVTAASRILKGFKSRYSATAVERLLEAGAVIIGRTNCDEFGMGSETTQSVYGATRNGSDERLVAGGSSGGAAVSVQLGCCLFALGSDTGGSVRQPAAYCGQVGLKPTYGRISRHGLLAYASSFDQIGLIGRRPEDLLEPLRIMAGPDAYDAGVSDQPVATSQTPPPTRLAYFRQLENHTGLHPEIRMAFFQRLASLRAAGYQVDAIDFPLLEYLVPAYYILTTAEASSNLSRYDGVRYGYRAEEAETVEELMRRTRTEGFGAEVKRRILLGAFVLSAGHYDAYYRKAQQVRQLIRQHSDKVFATYDFLVSPVSPVPPRPIAGPAPDPVATYLADVFTVHASLAGLPALAVPLQECPVPAGLQLTGPAFSEVELLNFAPQIPTARTQ